MPNGLLFTLNFEFISFSPMFSVKHEPKSKIASWCERLTVDFVVGVLRKKFILWFKYFSQISLILANLICVLLRNLREPKSYFLKIQYSGFNLVMPFQISKCTLVLALSGSLIKVPKCCLVVILSPLLTYTSLK